MIALDRTPDRWSIDDIYKAFDTGTTHGKIFGVIIGEYPLSYAIERSYVYARYALFNGAKNEHKLNGYTIFQGYPSTPIPNGAWKGEYYELMRDHYKDYRIQTYAGYICDTEFGTVNFVTGTGVMHTNPYRGVPVKIDDLFGSKYELYYVQDTASSFPVFSLGTIKIESDADYKAIQARRSQLRWVDLDETPRNWTQFEAEFLSWNDIYLGGPGLENH